MTDRIKLTVDYTYMVLDGQPRIVLGGSTVDVPSAAAYPSATVVTKGVSTSVPSNSHAITVSGVRTR